MSDIQQITAAGGVLYRQNGHYDLPQIVLIYRRGVWDLPKGKLENNETVQECAAREVAEEIGLSSLPQIVGRLNDTYHEYKQKGIHYGKNTHWFSMKVENWTEEELKPQTEEGIEAVHFFPLEQATGKVGYDNLVRVLESFQDWYRKRQE